METQDDCAELMTTKNVKDGAKDPDPKYLIITISKIVVPAAIWYYNLFFKCIYIYVELIDSSATSQIKAEDVKEGNL